MEAENTEFQTPPGRRILPTSIVSDPRRGGAAQQRSLRANQQELNPRRYQNQSMVSTTTLDETVRELQATMDLRNNMLLNTLNQRDLAQAEQLRFRDERLMQQVAQLISNRQESLNQVPAQRSNESRSLRPQENNQSQNNFEKCNVKVKS